MTLFCYSDAVRGVSRLRVLQCLVVWLSQSDLRTEKCPLPAILSYPSHPNVAFVML